MENNTAVCCDCDLRHISKPSSYWCSNCEEAICSECNERHLLRKSTRDHTTIPIEHYHRLPKSISDIKQHCYEHDERFQLFCKEHDRPICNKCIKAHATCTDFVPLVDIISNTKSSEAFNDVIRRLEDLAQNLKKIHEGNENNIAHIQECRKKCEIEIRSMRQQINQHMDRIETKMCSELAAAENKVTHDIKTRLDSLKEKQREVTECHATMQDIQQFASDLQAFIGVKNIENTLNKHESYMQQMIDDKALNISNIEVNIDSKMTAILENVQVFGSVCATTTGSSITIVRQKDKQAQILVDKLSSVNDINFKCVQKVNVFKTYMVNAIRGCDIAPNGEFIFTCHCVGKLICIRVDGSPNFTYLINGKTDVAFDVKFLDDRTAVYTSGVSNVHKLTMIDLTNRKILKSISLDGDPYGLSITDDSFIVAVKNIGIQAISRSTFQISTIVSRKLSSYSYVAACDGNVYSSEPDSNKVTCYDIKGQIVWEFDDKNILERPRGLAVDDNRNVFVTGERSKNVLVISPNGLKYKQLLTKDDGLTQPTGICFDRVRRKILVANVGSDAQFFEII